MLKPVDHYALSFAMHWGMKAREMETEASATKSEDDLAKAKELRLTDPDVFDGLMYEWANDFVDSEEEDPEEYFSKRLEKYLDTVINMPVIGAYGLCNTASVNVHEIDPYGDWVVASINGHSPKKCEVVIETTDGDVEEPETGFYIGELFVPLSQVMRVDSPAPAPADPWAELYKKYGFDDPTKSRMDMEEEEETAFVNDCFDLYEKEGFLDTFASPYSHVHTFNGRPFVVVDRATRNDALLETLPMWKIRFEDGTGLYAYPEEICKAEKDSTKWWIKEGQGA